MKLYIGRDSYGLWLFEQKPTKYIYNGDKCFEMSGNTRYRIDSRLFSEITFENSPQEIEINFINKEIEINLINKL